MTAPFDGPPLDPSSPEAQQWLRDELTGGGYTTQPSVWERFVEWLSQVFDGPSLGGLPGWVAALSVAVVVGVAVLVALRVVRRESRPGRARGGSAVVDEEGLDARTYRERARGSLERRDWDAGVLDAYRALATSAVERTLLDDLPGRTAHEVAVALTPVFPDHSGALADAADAFDAVRYGHRPATEGQARAVVALDAALATARPVLPEAAAT